MELTLKQRMEFGEMLGKTKQEIVQEGLYVRWYALGGGHKARRRALELSGPEGVPHPFEDKSWWRMFLYGCNQIT